MVEIKKYRWASIYEMFQALEVNNVNYVILRNYEELLNDNFYCSGHADIDFLTDDVNKFIKVLRAFPRFIEDDKIHYLVDINGTEVIIDVRTVGDDYYCKKWEKEILKNRTRINNWYVTDSVNYYYSLVYHAILQKKEFADDYKEHLAVMAKELGFEARELSEHIQILVSFMQKNRYYFTYPNDFWVPLNVNYVPNKMVKKVYKIYYRKVKSELIKRLVYVKRNILKIK